MKAEGGEICIHDQHYDTNNELFFMSLSTNCIPCYLKLYTEMFIKSNIQIHQMKMFDKIEWRRGSRRLHRIRACYDLNPNCEKLGLDCEFKIPKHGLKASKEIPVNLVKSKNKIRFNSYICFPKYKGEGDSIYKKNLALRRKYLDKSFRKTYTYLTYLKILEDVIATQKE